VTAQHPQAAVYAALGKHLKTYPHLSLGITGPGWAEGCAMEITPAGAVPGADEDTPIDQWELMLADWAESLVDATVEVSPDPSGGTHVMVVGRMGSLTVAVQRTVPGLLPSVGYMSSDEYRALVADSTDPTITAALDGVTA
jgi:hypothetical protein